MGKKSFKPVFISHGPPTLLLENIPAREFLKDIGKKYKNVNAVLCISAHWVTSTPTVNAVDINETIHDFYGFPPELYQIKYPAKGEPELAEITADLIKNKGLYCEIDYNRGLDHGAWIPLMLMFPELQIPVFQLSIQQHMKPEEHYMLGRAIESLHDEGVLILGSGGAVHPLGYAPLRPGAKTDHWAYEFDSWLTNSIEKGDSAAIKNYRYESPYPERAHPYPDHFMPLLTSMGASGEDTTGVVIHNSWLWGDMGMGAYEFQI
jgi:4,5-DOPA dioxygenase extradiol